MAESPEIPIRALIVEGIPLTLETRLIGALGNRLLLQNFPNNGILISDAEMNSISGILAFPVPGGLCLRVSSVGEQKV